MSQHKRRTSNALARAVAMQVDSLSTLLRAAVEEDNRAEDGVKALIARIERLPQKIITKGTLNENQSKAG